MKRTILMLALDELADYGKTRLDYDIKTIGSYIRNFNMYGYRVLLATSRGSKLLEIPKDISELDSPSFNFPLPIEGLSEEDCDSFCCLYILGGREISWRDLLKVESISNILPHFIENHKIVAVQSPSTQCVFYPPMEQNVFCPQLDAQGSAKPGVSLTEFSQSVMNLIALQYIP